MDESQYTLPGVMRFLRSEWQRREREKIEWDIEKAELKSRIARLESEKLELRKDRDDVRRHLEILSLKFRAPPDPADEVGSAAGAPSAAAENSDNVTEAVLATVSESRTYLNQCIADIRSVLRQSGMIQGDFVPIAPYQQGFGSDRNITLANFGTAATAIAALPSGSIVAGTVDGDIIWWNNLRQESTIIEHHQFPINYLTYSEPTKTLYAAVGSQLVAYSTTDSIQHLATEELAKDAAIVYLTVPPRGNIVTAVQENGACTVFTLHDGTNFEVLSQPTNYAHSCSFVDIEGDITLVIATSPDATEPSSSNESGILFVDPLTGQKLKKIVFSAAAGIGALVTTDDTIVIGMDNGDLRAIGLSRGETIAEVPAAHRGEITSLTLLKDATLLSTSTDGRVSLWSVPELMWKGRLFSHDSGYGALCSSRVSSDDGAAVGGGDGLIRVYHDL